MQPKILVKFATRSRPRKFINCLENYSHFSEYDNYQIIVSADIDDASMYNKEIIDAVKNFDNVQIIFGVSRNKVDAINRDISIATKFDILINLSDDMLFVKKGFDLMIINDFQVLFPDYDGVLHYDDGNHYGNKLMTMSIMGNAYYDRFGYIYHPAYESVYCDNEAMEVAKKLGKYVYIPNTIFNHNHPAWGKAPWDEQYRKTEEPGLYRKDNETFKIRRKNNFYLF